jgi:hypothetical protein
MAIMNSILAYYPGKEPEPQLWHKPGDVVFLAYSGHTTWQRICSKADFDANHSVLLQQGWILGEAKDN